MKRFVSVRRSVCSAVLALGAIAGLPGTATASGPEDSVAIRANIGFDGGGFSFGLNSYDAGPRYQYDRPHHERWQGTLAGTLRIGRDVFSVGADGDVVARVARRLRHAGYTVSRYGSELTVYTHHPRGVSWSSNLYNARITTGYDCVILKFHRRTYWPGRNNGRYQGKNSRWGHGNHGKDTRWDRGHYGKGGHWDGGRQGKGGHWDGGRQGKGGHWDGDRHGPSRGGHNGKGNGHDRGGKGRPGNGGRRGH